MPLNEKLEEFPDLSHHAFQHTKDSKATAALEKVPGVSKILAYISEKGFERQMLHQSISSRLKISEKQYPSIYRQFVKMAKVLDVRMLPALYIETSPTINAYAMGIENYSIVLCSGLIDIMEEDELMAILGHELGHVKCQHQKYKTMAHLFTTLGQAVLSGSKLPIPGLDLLLTGARFGIEYHLADWSRMAELSCDRAALLATQDVVAVSGALTKLAGFSRKYASELNIDAAAEQADELEELRSESMLMKLLRIQALTEQTHPDTVIRVREARLWAESDQYQQILKKNYAKMVPDAPAGMLPAIQLTTPRGRMCPKCVRACEENSTFCAHCGTNVRNGTLVCGRCNKSIEEVWVHCLSCGNQLLSQARQITGN